MNNTGTTAPGRSIVISDPDAKATSTQLRVIGHMVKEHKLRRYAPEAWNAITKGKAAEIITRLYAKFGEIPASETRKKKLKELIRRGHLKDLRHGTYMNLSSNQAQRMIFLGEQNAANGVTVEGFAPRETSAPDAPMTDRQRNRLEQLIVDGHLAPLKPDMFRTLTREQASYFIGMGKKHQSKMQFPGWPPTNPHVPPAA